MERMPAFLWCCPRDSQGLRRCIRTNEKLCTNTHVLEIHAIYLLLNKNNKALLAAEWNQDQLLFVRNPGKDRMKPALAGLHILKGLHLTNVVCSKRSSQTLKACLQRSCPPRLRPPARESERHRGTVDVVDTGYTWPWVCGAGREGTVFCWLRELHMLVLIRDWLFAGVSSPWLPSRGGDCNKARERDPRPSK